MNKTVVKIFGDQVLGNVAISLPSIVIVCGLNPGELLLALGRIDL
jgi:hypothetical protein